MPHRRQNSTQLVPSNQSKSTASGKRIVLRGTDRNKIFQKELRGVVVTGHVRRVKTAPECNIIETVLTSLKMEDSTLVSCDIKDSSIRESHFDKCDLARAALPTIYF